MPVNISLLPDEVIARGITGADWSKAPQAFWAGQDRAQQEALQNLFSGGIPRDPNNPNALDYGKMAEALARVGGAPQIQNILGLSNLQEQQKLPPIPVLTMPPEAMPQQPSQVRVPSIQRTGGLPVEDQGGGEPKPTPQNVVQDSEVPGSARMSVDGGPEQPIQVASNAPTVPQFRQAQPTPTQPVSGPRTDRFAQVPQQDSNFNPDTAARWSMIGNAALEAGRRAAGLGNKTLAESYNLKAAEAFANAKMIREHIGKSEELTPEIKQYQLGREPGETLPGYQARTKGMETLATEDVKDFRKEAVAIQAAGRNAFSGLQKAQLAKNLTLDPNFYSGPFQPNVQTYKQFKAIFGNNPSAALPQEAFNKEVSDLLQEQIKSMGQSGVGRVLMSEVAIMRQAVSSLAITPQSNRALLEISSRVYKQQQAIADIASKIKAPPGQMSNALDQSVGVHLSKNPLFTPDELRNPTLLGAPDAPPQSAQWSPQQRRMWAQGIGLKPGDPIRFNGQIGAVP